MTQGTKTETKLVLGRNRWKPKDCANYSITEGGSLWKAEHEKQWEATIAQD